MEKSELNFELLKATPDYWAIGLSTKYSNFILQHFKEINDGDLIDDGLPENGIVKQLREHCYDPKLSKMTELVFKCGYVPVIDFAPIDSVIKSLDSSVLMSVDELKHPMSQSKTMKHTRFFSTIRSLFKSDDKEVNDEQDPDVLTDDEIVKIVEHTLFGDDETTTLLTDDEIVEFVSGRFLRCIFPVCHWMKQGESYWFEYVGNGRYNVRSDNNLGKDFYMTVHQLITGYVPVEFEEDPYKMLEYFFLLGKANINKMYIDKMIDYYKTVGLVDSSK